MHRRRGTSDTAADLREHFGASEFTTAQAEQVGVSPRRLAIAADAGLIVRLRRGLYVAPGQVPASTTDEGLVVAEAGIVIARHRAAQLRSRGIAASVSDESAASTWGLPHRSSAAPSLRVPDSAAVHLGTRHGVRIRHGSADDVVLFNDVPLTSPLATARDICRGLPRYRAVALFGLAQRRQAEWLLAADDRLEAGDLTQALTDADLRTHVSQAMHHLLSGSLRHQQWNASADPRPETYLEAISWGRFTGWRLGDMQPQAWVHGASGRRYRVDVLIDGIAGEADGAVKYGQKDTLWKEKLRQEDIEGGGTPVVRWTYAEAEHRPHLLLARWRAALHRHAA